MTTQHQINLKFKAKRCPLFKRFTIRKKLILGIMVGFIIPYTIGGLYIKNSTEKWLYANNIEHSQSKLMQTAGEVDQAVMEMMSNLIAVIANDERIQNSQNMITSFVNFGTEDFQRLDSEEERAILSFFKNIQETYDDITLVAFGNEEGGYIEYPYFSPNAPYDPRLRPWYMEALSKDAPNLSEPYVTQVTEELVISVAKSIETRGEKSGVVSITTRLDQLMTNINALKIGETGYITILSPKGTFLNDPSDQGLVMKNVHEDLLEPFEKLSAYNGESFIAPLGETEKIFNVYISPLSGWQYVSIIDKDEVLAQSRVLVNLLLFTLVGILLITLTIIVAVSSYITKPILSISKIMGNMSKLNFDAIDHAQINKLRHHNDEIGTISSALHEMQNSFTELKSNMDHMDQAINQIDINQEAIHFIKLSEENPFSGIARSVNALLKKVHNYIGQLAASEEELMAQVEEINDQKKEITFLAEHDPLTELANRRMFQIYLNDIINKNHKGAVIMMDLDNFKSINDTLGHLFGDKVLKHVADTLKSLQSDSVFVSRFGGDEFLILCRCNDNNLDLHEFIDKLYKAIRKPFYIEENEINIAFSLGISMFPNDSSSIDELIMNADLALYEAKSIGKNNYALFDTKMSSELKQKLQIQSILTEALESSGFKMLYQPQVDLRSGKVVGYEALIRLKHHHLSPLKFIKVAEENGQIIPIGREVVKMVIEQIAKWQAKGMDVKPVSINFSANQIKDHEFNAYLTAMMMHYQVKPEKIVIEITENIFIENKTQTQAFLNELDNMGIKIAIDDFGTGYSALSYLTYLPIDTLKLDRSLSVRFLEEDKQDVMDSLIALAHSLGLNVIAEGIETEAHIICLKNKNCDAVQGYYFSKPVEASEIEKLWQKVYDIRREEKAI